MIARSRNGRGHSNGTNIRFNLWPLDDGCPLKGPSFSKGAYVLRTGSVPWSPGVLRCYWSLARTAEAPLEHNFRYSRIRELTVDNDAIALGGQGALFLFLFSSISLSLLISSTCMTG
jgi:hypothetical protein